MLHAPVTLGHKSHAESLTMHRFAAIICSVPMAMMLVQGPARTAGRGAGKGEPGRAACRRSGGPLAELGPPIDVLSTSCN